MTITQPRRWPWLILLGLLGIAACAMRWYYVATALVDHPIRGDATQYYAYAWNLVHHGMFSKAMPGAESIASDSFRDPGYPLFLAGWMFATGGDENGWYAGVLVSQAVLGGITAMLLASLCRRWLPASVALCAGLLTAAWPHSVAMNGYLLSETLFGFFAVLGLCMLAGAFWREKPWMAGLAGLCFALGTLVNSILLPFAPLVAMWLGWRRHWPRRMLVAFLVGALVLPAGWMMRSAYIGAGDSARNRALINLVQGSWPTYHKAYRAAVIQGDVSSQRTLEEIGREQDEMIASPAAGLAQLMSRFSAAPMTYLSWYLLRKPLLFWGWDIQMGQGGIYTYPTANSPFDTLPAWRILISLCHSLNAWLLSAAAGGIVALVVRRWRPKLSVKEAMLLESVVVLVVYATAIYGLLQSEPRYSIPFRPLEIALAASAMYWIFKLVRKWRTGIGASEDGSGRVNSGDQCPNT